MSEAFISRRSDNNYTMLKFNNYSPNIIGHTIVELSQARKHLAATTVGVCALFAGGEAYNSGSLYFSTVDAYNKNNLTRSTRTPLSTGRRELAATTVGDYALIALGGAENTSAKSNVDVYNGNLIRSNTLELSLARIELLATSTETQALFAGGRSTGNVSQSVVDVYNSDLLRSNPDELSKGRQNGAATTVGKYALFGGGYTAYNNNFYCAVVDVYYENLGVIEFTACKNSTYKFQNMSDAITVKEDFSTISIPAPATGYVKFKNTNIS